MSDRVHTHVGLIYSEGTHVVVMRDIVGQHGRILHPQGAVGVVIRSPRDLEHPYRVRFPDDVEESVRRDDVVMLAQFQAGEIGDSAVAADQVNLFQHVIYRCIIGSRAYGLENEASDTDYRGIFLPPAELHWSLYGVPNQIEKEDTQEQYWELQRFLVLALKANPNVLECLYIPLVEKVTPLAEELLSIREAFLSRLVYQTYNGYVLSQFKLMQGELRNRGAVKWKHVMHLLRLLMSGISVLRNGFVPVRVDERRDQLLAVRQGEVPWEVTEKWRIGLHAEFDQALADTRLPERPDYRKVNDFLIKARTRALQGQS